MTITSSKLNVTPEELLNFSDAGNYELVNGNLVERNMGSESSAIALAIGSILHGFVRSRRAGHVFTTDCGYQCFPEAPGKIRRPDVSFVRSGRLPGGRPPEGYITVAPDLAVEVLSPGDLAYEIDEKINEYLGAGVPLVWVVNPKTKSVRIHRRTGASLGSISGLNESDTISGEEVLAGFEVKVSEFFEI